MEEKYFIQNFGSNLARLRKERDVKQEELANAIGVSKNSISNIEKGKAYPTFNNLDKIAKFFRATPTQLFGTNQDIELEISAENIDEYNEKALNILKANKIVNDYYKEMIDLENGKGDPIFGETVHAIFLASSLMRKDQATTDDGTLIYKNSVTGKMMPVSDWSDEYTIPVKEPSKLEQLLSKKDELLEIANLIDYIKENEGVLNHGKEN
ncbi:helix-turn-helix transcriptional regulator [Streptococcaceae bacterium ESL0729]|nr:helix-turn-helix transcriptional regulator [Streptococcaceae bacterium ESL0729]